MSYLWEFKFDGSFSPKQIPAIEDAPKKGYNWDTALAQAGFEHLLMMNAEGSELETKVYHQKDGTSFLIDMWAPCVGVGSIYCDNLPTLLEFFRRYAGFLN